MVARVIRSLEDFLEVPQDQLPNCLAALRRAIESHKRLRVAAKDRGIPATFTEFEWKPREKRKPLALQVTATTPVQDLGLKPAAVLHFREMNLYALEDFAEVSAIDLRRVPDVGDSTVAQIRELLDSVGLRFREPENPWYRAEQRARLARAMSEPERAKAITDTSHVADLGLKTTTLNRCIEKGILTVGELRALTLRDLYSWFGRQSLIDLLRCLDAVGLQLQSSPSQLERWHFGAIRKEDLTRPQESAPVQELAPWIPAATPHLAREGIRTVGDLAQLAKAGGQRMRGVGQSAWDDIFDYFGEPRRAVSRKWR